MYWINMPYFLIVFLLFFMPMAWAEVSILNENCNNKYAAKVVSLQGTFLVDPERKGTWHSARLNELICEGSGIKVAANSRASLRLGNDVVLRLHEGTNATLDAISTNQPTLIQLLKGFIHFISRTPRMMKINTPIANGGPEGTEFAMRVDDNKASLWVYEGGVKFYNDKGSVFLKPGEGGQTLKGQAPQAKIDIKPQDAVTWALYYPPALPYPDKNAVIDNELRTAINDYRQGHTDTALARLDSLPTTQQTPFFYQARAAMRLTLGQDQLALQDIQRLLINNPQDADALALHAILALTQNRKDEAYALATQAIAANPQAASAYSALSYAEQSRFQLDKAQAAANKATELAPHDAMVWARKAELLLSQGLTAESQQAAEKAIALDANLERTQTVLGFSYLLRMDTDAALETFNKAIEFDSTSPLARLGLGLAKIRKGDLEQGREDLETAAILDPNNSIVRSYLGKAYYEERRSPLAEDQFKLAKERDPKDPTPYFYDAINKQTTNRPVEALQDIEKAIKLNDNRGIYRSSLALDKDLAARSAAQGRIYSDLGFQQLGLVEGWKSVNAEPSDYSGHRLLADSYSIRPNYEIARVSELLQSQLLQPISITPVQPQLAERNLLSAQSSGPGALSFNEFNPMFQRDRFALQTSGVVGSNDTYGDEVTHSGLWRNLSYSLGQYHYQTNGFRPNNDLNVDLFNGFIQASINPNLSVQAEIRHKITERGDIDLKADGFSDSVFRLGSDKDSYRAGLRYSFSHNSNLIASFIHTNSDAFQVLSSENGKRRTDFISTGDQGEIQHLFRSNLVSTVAGFGFAQSDFKRVNVPLSGTSDSHVNGYLYSYMHYPHNVDWTLGLSVDSLESTPNDPNIPKDKSKQINPKVGMIWRATKGTTIRGAVIKTLKRSLITNQTIEPTQVAGFNQFYDDFTFTDAWLYGMAIDQKWGSRLFGGLEFIARNLKVPPVVWYERSYRAYLNWNITPKISANFAFHLEDFKGDNTSVPLSTTTYDSKAGLRFFDPSGFFCNLEAEYVNQRTDWSEGFDGSPIRHNEFVLVNTGIGYRLPKRFGIVQLDIKNIFDQRFNYQSLGNRSPGFSDDAAGQPPPFIPGRTVFARFTLAF